MPLRGWKASLSLVMSPWYPGNPVDTKFHGWSSKDLQIWPKLTGSAFWMWSEVIFGHMFKKTLWGHPVMGLASTDYKNCKCSVSRWGSAVFPRSLHGKKTWKPYFPKDKWSFLDNGTLLLRFSLTAREASLKWWFCHV